MLAAKAAAIARHVFLTFHFKICPLDEGWSRTFVLAERSGPLLPTLTLETTPRPLPLTDIRDGLCTIWPHAVVRMAELYVPQAGLTCCLWEPQLPASSCGCAGQTRGCWPT